MKNEVIVKAITEIDDALIVSALCPAKSKRKGVMRFCAYAAACLILVCGIISLSRSNSATEIFITGEAVSSQPITVLSSNTRQIAMNVIVVPIEIVSKGKLTVTAIDGTIEVYSSKTNEQISDGRFCETKGSVTVQWIIENPDYSQTYKIQVNNQKTMLILQHEQPTNKWIIIKSED